MAETGPLHIACYAPQWPPSTAAPNGITTALYHTVSAMQARGHSVTIVGGKSGKSVCGEHVVPAPVLEDGIFEKILWRILPPRRRQAWFMRRMGTAIGEAFARVHEDHPIDIIESEESFGLPSDIRRVTRLPVVARLHGPWREAVAAVHREESGEDRMRIAREDRAIEDADGVTAPSAATLAPYQERARRSRVLYNPIPPAKRLWYEEGCDPKTRGEHFIL